jgi:hypothetical protein
MIHPQDTDTIVWLDDLAISEGPIGCN